MKQKDYLQQTLIALITLLFSCGAMTAQTNYGVKIAGTPLTSANVGAINNTNFPNLGLSRGTITYDHTSQTFTLDNVQASPNGAVFLYIAAATETIEYKLNLVGTNEVNIVSGKHSAIATSDDLRITGTSLKLNAPNRAAIIVGMGATLTIKDATVEAIGAWGIEGLYGTDNEKLVIDHATVKTTGSIWKFQDIILTRSTITAPAGATVAPNGADGKAVMLGQEVVTAQVVVEPEGTSIFTPLAESFTLHPNPVADMLHVEAAGEVRRVCIYNMYGVQVAAAADTAALDVSHLPAGIYTVAVETTKGAGREKMIKH